MAANTKKKIAALVEVGQRWRRNKDERVARIMAVADGYAMVRFLACYPFIESVKVIERDWERYD